MYDAEYDGRRRGLMTFAPLKPAAAAARRTGRRTRGPRGFEPSDTGDLTGEGIVVAATRALLAARSREHAADVLLTAISDLGGAVVPARLAETNRHALPCDVSLGVGEPLLVVVPALSVDALKLGCYLPGLLQEAFEAAQRCDIARRLVELASVDPLAVEEPP